MNIRCPQCEFTRSLDENKVPPTAELATCPKCKHRFRFRSIAPKPDYPFNAPAGEGQRPSVIEKAGNKPHIDLWDAVDSLHERWENEGKLKKGGLPGGESTVQNEEPQDKTAPHSKDVYAGYTEQGLPRAPEATEGKGEETEHVDPESLEDLPAKDLPEAPPAGFTDGRVAEDKPTRDLGRLDDNAPWGSGPENWPGKAAGKATGKPLPGGAEYSVFPEKPGKQPEGQRIPWEAHFGSLQAFWQTLLKTMLDARGFFSSLRSGGSLVPSFVFYAASFIFYLIMYVAWAYAAIRYASEQDVGVSIQFGRIPLLIFFLPVLAFVNILFTAGIIHQVMRLLLPEKADFSISFKVVAYAASPLMLAVVPLLGVLAGAMMHIVLLILGFRYAFSLSWSQTLLSVLPFFFINALLAELFFRMMGVSM